MRSRGCCDRSEANLEALLDDPVMQIMMARDGVERDDLVSLVEEMRERLATREPA
jgi:hypothetical protein